VYVIIGLFALASAMALYACLKVVMLKIPGLGRCRWVRVTHGTVMSGVDCGRSHIKWSG